MHIFRWDLDRTYLATDIGSMRGLIRAAFESADSKRNVPGSAELLRALALRDPTAQVCILSGSPTQLRTVLEEKLTLDGVRFDKLILKDNLGHLKRGRLRAVTGQLGYKLPVLLAERIGLGPGVTETLFGDDTEVDAVIYGIYADALAGRVSPAQVSRVLEAGGAYPDSIRAALASLERVGRADAVRDIFIRVDRGVPLKQFELLTPRVTPIFSWFQAAVILWRRGRITIEDVYSVTKAVITEAGHDTRVIVGLTQDLVRRGLTERDIAADLLVHDSELAAIQPQISTAIARLGHPTTPVPPRDQPDYLAFLRALH